MASANAVGTEADAQATVLYECSYHFKVGYAPLGPAATELKVDENGPATLTMFQNFSYPSLETGILGSCDYQYTWTFVNNVDLPSLGDLIQTVRLGHTEVVIDIANPEHPVEVSRALIDGLMFPHWSGYDAKTHRIAVTGYGENRLFMLMFDPETGAIAMDGAFHDQQGRPGFDLSNRAWPHGWTGTAQTHGVVFSR